MSDDRLFSDVKGIVRSAVAGLDSPDGATERLLAVVEAAHAADVAALQRELEEARDLAEQRGEAIKYQISSRAEAQLAALRSRLEEAEKLLREAPIAISGGGFQWSWRRDQFLDTPTPAPGEGCPNCGHTGSYECNNGRVGCGTCFCANPYHRLGGATPGEGERG